MMADAVHSLSDFVTDVVVILFVRISNKPQDKGHDYGHGKYETLATALIGVALLGVGCGILWNGAGEILAFMRGEPVSYTHLKMLCADIILEMIADDFLQEVEKGQYKLNDHGLIMTGIFQRKSNGKNSFIPEDGGETIFIAERNSAHAMNNDKVKIALFAKRKNRNPEGEVIEIIERANDTFVGTLKVDKFYAFLVTENRTLANDIFIPKDKLKGGKNGDKAVVKIIEWPKEAKNPIGQVMDILGKAGENTTEMHAILSLIHI